MKSPNAKYQAALREREKAAGIVRKTVAIPLDRAEELEKIVKAWMADHRAARSSEEAP